MNILLNKILKKIPQEDETDFRSQNRELFLRQNKTCVVIDDDPTGNQTVYDIPLLTEWDMETIATEFKKETPIFFILTNSRSLPQDKSSEIYTEIAKNIKEVSVLLKRDFSIISRSDSTLRGHFPSEIEAIHQGAQFEEAINVFIPVMFEGGRVTLNDSHYVSESEKLIPVGETPFSKDQSFGYSKSNLKEWIEEKTKGKIKSSNVYSISIEEIRILDINSLVDRIIGISSGSFCVINSLNYNDLDKISNALILAENKGKRIVYRTSSSFVPAYIGLKQKPLLNSEDLLKVSCLHGGLTIVGSYVPKSSTQLKHALKIFQKEAIIELNVNEILKDNSEWYLKNISYTINKLIEKGEKVIVYTSRNLIKGNTINENLTIGNIVSTAIIKIVKGLKIRPKYLISKGGITSHDIAVKGLQMKQSKVIGQILPGIPVWEMGAATKFPKLPYIVFPGNVGDEKTLVTIIKKLT